jgi:hypothetical protein
MAIIQVQIRKNIVEDVLLDGGSGVNIIIEFNWDWGWGYQNLNYTI